MKRVLIVDDDKLIRLGIKKAIQREDIEVKTAKSLEEAKKRLGSDCFDLCFLDIKLPDGSGIDLSGYIEEVAPLTKIIFMSATHIDEELMKRMKGHLFMQKPFDLTYVRMLMNHALNK